MGGTRFLYAAFFFGEREGDFFFLLKEEVPLAKTFPSQKTPFPRLRLTPP